MAGALIEAVGFLENLHASEGDGLNTLVHSDTSVDALESVDILQQGCVLRKEIEQAKEVRTFPASGV
jgi:hypothetical protein